MTGKRTRDNLQFHLNWINEHNDGEKTKIPLTKGRVALVDARHWDYLAQFNWFAIPNKHKDPNSAHYAIRNKWNPKEQKNYQQYMHREVLKQETGKQVDKDLDVDHKNKIPLDNRVSNLRAVTRTENLNNSKNNVIIEYQGKTKTITQWARHFNINRSTIIARYKSGIRGEALFDRNDNSVKYQMTHQGKTQTLPQWAAEYQISYQIVFMRYKAGHPPEKVLSKTKLVEPIMITHNGETHSLYRWSKIKQIKSSTAMSRWRKGIREFDKLFSKRRVNAKDA